MPASLEPHLKRVLPLLVPGMASSICMLELKRRTRTLTECIHVTCPMTAYLADSLQGQLRHQVHDVRLAQKFVLELLHCDWKCG